MYNNFTNRRLINNVGYQIRPTYFYDAGFQVPKNSVHDAFACQGGGVMYRNTTIDGVQVGGGIQSPASYTPSQQGSGFTKAGMHTLYEAYQKMKNSVGTNVMHMEEKLSNTIHGLNKSRNPNWRPGYPGEHHMRDPVSGIKMNFAGPGTQIKKRLERGDPPLNGKNSIDDCARTHDIAYHNAKEIKDVRKADQVFNKCVNKSTDSFLSKAIVRSLMKSKMLGEDMGLISKEKFVSLPNVGAKNAEYNPIEFNGSGLKFDIPLNSLKKKIKRKKSKDPARRLRALLNKKA